MCIQYLNLKKKIALRLFEIEKIIAYKHKKYIL